MNLFGCLLLSSSDLSACVIVPVIIARHSVSHVHDGHKGVGSPADAVSPKHLNLQDVLVHCSDGTMHC